MEDITEKTDDLPERNLLATVIHRAWDDLTSNETDIEGVHFHRETTKANHVLEIWEQRADAVDFLMNRIFLPDTIFSLAFEFNEGAVRTRVREQLARHGMNVKKTLELPVELRKIIKKVESGGRGERWLVEQLSRLSRSAKEGDDEQRTFHASA